MKTDFPASLSLLCMFGVGGFVGETHAADHREAPLIREDPTADIADFYAFLNPNDPDRLVLAMTVNAFSAPAENTTYAFSPNVRYSFRIDSTGDAIADSSVDVVFGDPALGAQTYKVFIDGDYLLSGGVTPPTVSPEPNEPIIASGRDGSFGFAGQRDDPFFFDSVGFVRLFEGGTFTGVDGFAGFNVSAIVLDLPVDMFLAGSDGNLQIWSVTERRRVTLRRSTQGELERSTGPWQQVDRMGNPAVNGLIAPGFKDFFNIGLPEHDPTDFAPLIIGAMMAFGMTQENIDILASIVVPDTLKIDVNEPSVFPNGRNPWDDAMDTLVFYVFNQIPISDGVDANDKAFLASFPFFAAPHQPE